MEMAVITPPWYSLQEANIVSFLTELEVRVWGRGPTYKLFPLEKTKQSAHEWLLSMCLCTFFWALHPGTPQPGFKATAAGYAGLPGLHPSPGQSGTQPFISWLGCFLTEKEDKEMVFSQLHPPSASARRGDHTSWAAQALSAMSRFHSFLLWTGQLNLHRSVCVCAAHAGIHPGTLWPAGTLYQVFLCLHLRIQIVRDAESRAEGKLRCHEGTVFMKLIQALSLKTQKEGRRDSRNLLFYEPASFPSEWVCVSTCDGNL